MTTTTVCDAATAGAGVAAAVTTGPALLVPRPVRDPVDPIGHRRNRAHRAHHGARPRRRGSRRHRHRRGRRAPLPRLTRLTRRCRTRRRRSLLLLQRRQRGFLRVALARLAGLPCVSGSPDRSPVSGHEARTDCRGAAGQVVQLSEQAVRSRSSRFGSRRANTGRLASCLGESTPQTQEIGHGSFASYPDGDHRGDGRLRLRRNDGLVLERE